MTKRILGLILALAMLCAFVPCVATAAESGSCGDNVTWVLDDNGTLYISGTGDMWDYHSSGYLPWYNNRYGINTIVVDNGVTYIGNYAFDGCSGATSVTIGGSVTKIGRDAFSDCSGLKSVVIPDSVTYIDNYVFDGCNGLVDVTIGSKVTYIGAYAFSGCKGLKSIVIPDRVTVIGNSAFSNCTNLSNVIIGKSVTTIGGEAFSGCSQLTSLTLPYSLTTINSGGFGHGAFYGCTNLSVVYYEGSAEDWQNITINGDDGSLTNATIYYGSAAPVTTVTTPATSTSNNTVIVILNGVTLVFDYPPTIIDGRTLVPLRKIFESIGATVTWDDATKTVISTYNGVTITLTIGSNVLYKNGYPVELDVPAQLLSDYTMVPVRAVAESFGADVAWDASTNTVSITTK